jgi:putative FmdB family regulatory protein
MPIYEYRCPEGHAFELFQGFNEPIPEACEICGKGPVQRVLYPVAVHFKGSGFYSTDYGRGSRKKDAAREGEAKAGEPSSDGSVKRTEPEPKKKTETEA